MTVFRLFTTGVATNQTAPSQKDIQYISTSFTGVNLMTVTAIMVIPRWRTWNQVRMFFVD